MTTTILQTAAPAKVSHHIGNVGDRIRIEGVVRKIIGSSYGKAALYLIHDIDGNEFEVRWTKYQAGGASVRSLVAFEPTVTGHTECCDVKRTQVSPGALERILDSHAFRRA